MGVDGVVVLDRNGGFLSANEAACGMLGSSLAQLRGARIFDYIEPEAHENSEKTTPKSDRIHASPCRDVVARLHNPRSAPGRLAIISAEPTFDPATGKPAAIVLTLRDLAERTQPETDLWKATSTFGDIASHTNCALFLFDVEGHVAYANSPARDWFPYTTAATSQPYFESQDDDQLARVVAESFRTGMAFRGEQFSRFIGDEDRQFQPVATPIGESGETRPVALLIFDVTEQKLAEKWLRNAMTDLRNRNAETSALLDSARLLLRGSGFQDAVKDIFERCKRLIGAESGYILRFNEGPLTTDSLLVGAEKWSHPDVPDLTPMGVPGLEGEVYHAAKPMYENDFQHSRWADLVPAHHMQIKNVLYAPLVVEGRVVGLLGLSNKPGGFNANDLRLAGAFAELIAVSLYNSDTTALIQRSERLYRSVVAVLEEGIVLVDHKGSVIGCNATAERILGVTREHMRSQQISAFLDPIYREDGAAFVEELRPWVVTLRIGKPCSGIVMGVCKPEGGVVWLSVGSQPLFLDGQDKPYGAVISFTDITYRKGAEENVSFLARHIRLLLESTDVGIFGMDLSGRCTFLNSYGGRLLGYDPDEVLERDIHGLIHDGDADGHGCQREDCEIIKVLETGKGIRGNGQLFRKADGSWFPTDFSCYPTVDEGTITGAVVTFTDITQRKLVEDALHDSRAQLTEAQRVAHVGSYRWDRGKASLNASEEMFNILDLVPPGADISIRRCLGQVHPGDAARVRSELRRALREKRSYSFEFRIALPDGKMKHAHALGRPRRNDSGKIIGVTGTLMDITDRKQLEERLLRAQLLEAAGRVAGQVAHDFNNLLAPLALYPDLLRMQLPKGHPGIRYCEGMLEAVQQMADINADLLTLGRRAHTEHQLIDMNRVVRQAAERLIDKPESLKVASSLTPDLPLVRGSSAQILRVVMNLVLNAREAMNDNGTLTIKTDTVYLDEPFSEYDRVEAGEYVRLTVSDTGHGIPTDIRNKIFDAFFTTKRTGKKPGTGLGLSIVLAVVDDHHGYMDLESAVGKGTTFAVYLPACWDKAERAVSTRLRGGSETILVVDDDRALREAVAELLSQLGYHVETVASGEAAVVWLSDNPVDLLVLDMIMPPGIDGTETFRQVREIRPDQKAIIMSGFAESDRVKEALRLGAGAFLRKPASMERFAKTVRAELDRDPGLAPRSRVDTDADLPPDS